jgi:pimeloyl-ACP methyl ester carboxylesterase
MKDAYDDADAASLYFTVNDTKLHTYLLGDPNNPPLVMLHGMQDLSGSLLPVARKLSERYSVWLPDLRGHGRSVRPGTYSMSAFVYDVYALISTQLKQPAALFGHSLGGQICVRVAALFSELVTAAVIVEGLGPSAAAMAARSRKNINLEQEAARLKGVYGHQPRPLPNINAAARKLVANNPRLGDARARAIASIATESRPDGTLAWAFDSLVRAVFIGSEDAPKYWPQVPCPVLLVAGNHAHEYWTRATGLACADGGDFEPGELRSRQQIFPNAELVEFAGSGHMVHFDEPERLANVSFEFLCRI